MTFTNYMCYIGGLFGMWFGISANQLFEKIKWFYLSFKFKLILFLYNIEEVFLIIIILIKHLLILFKNIGLLFGKWFAIIANLIYNAIFH